MFCLHSNGTGFPKHKRTRALLPKPLRGATALQNNGKFWPNQRRSMASWEPMGSCAPSLNHYDQNVTHAGIGRQPWEKHSEVPSSNRRLTGGPCKRVCRIAFECSCRSNQGSTKCIIQTLKSNARRQCSLEKWRNPTAAEWRLPRWRG